MNFSVHFDEVTIERLREAVGRSGVARNRIIVHAVQEWLDRNAEKGWPAALRAHWANPAPLEDTPDLLAWREQLPRRDTATLVRYLLDTGTIADAVRGRLPVVLRMAQLKPGDVAVSAVSRMEAEAALRLQPRAQGRHGRLLKELFGAVRSLEFGVREAQQAASLAGASPGLSGFDLMIAATALSHQLTLVTAREDAFAGVPSLETESWT